MKAAAAANAVECCTWADALPQRAEVDGTAGEWAAEARKAEGDGSSEKENNCFCVIY